MNTETVLSGLGVSPTAKGYRYLVDAINYQVEHNNYYGKFYEVYDTIAEKYNVKSGAVQKCIFYCIEKCSPNSADKALWRSILGKYGNTKRTAPGNKVFICLVAQYILLTRR